MALSAQIGCHAFKSMLQVKGDISKSKM